MRSKLAERLSAPGVRFKSLPWGSRFALLFLVVIALAAIFAPVLAPHDPLETFILRKLRTATTSSAPTAWAATSSPGSFTAHSLRS
ncbi:ABC transporter protein [Arthrobacter sp. Hiyo1]|nr:ABC transporter protein [Arthrobacter sp. Hiyo1]